MRSWGQPVERKPTERDEVNDTSHRSFSQSLPRHSKAAENSSGESTASLNRFLGFHKKKLKNASCFTIGNGCSEALPGSPRGSWSLPQQS